MRSAEGAARGRLAAALLIAASLVLVVGAATRTTQAQQMRRKLLASFPRGLMSVRTAAGSVLNFKIWVANTPDRSEQGLMFVRHLEDHQAMLFPFTGHGPIVMWMKNTYLPLDMLFVDRHGRITEIARRTKPLSLDLIYAPSGTRAVIEMRGGDCRHLGIDVGDAVLSDALKSAR